MNYLVKVKVSNLYNDIYYLKYLFSSVTLILKVKPNYLFSDKNMPDSIF